MKFMESILLNEEQVAYQKNFMAKVYGWMSLALLISALSAFSVTQSEFLFKLVFGNSYSIFILIIIEFVLVIWLSSSIRRISTSAASIGFILYSIVNGLTLSSVFIIYTGSSIMRVFLISALMFIAMTLYGLKTKSDLMSAGRYLSMALFGIIIASVINIFLHSSGLDWIISIIAVGVFTGLTAYDTQKLLRISKNANDSENYSKVSIVIALELYLDFINIFLRLLRLFGKRNN